MGHSLLRISGYVLKGASHFWLGNYRTSSTHLEATLSEYDLDAHRVYADIMNHDPKTAALLYRAKNEWILGYPARATETFAEVEQHVALRNHPFDQGFGLMMGAGA